MDRVLMEKYAAFLVKSGINLQKGQTLIISAPIEGAEFVRLCVKAAYESGAREVVVKYNDEKLARMQMEYTDVEVLEDIKPWIIASYMDYVNTEGGVANLKIIARNPEVYKGLDSGKVDRANTALSKAMRPYSELTMASKVQWCVAAIPGEAWAGKIYPDLPNAEAQEKLWKTIFDVCRVSGGDPEGEWEKHAKNMQGHSEWLNGLQLAELHLQSANGTDLIVGLADDHLWGGATEPSADGVMFLPNIPTEEVFTAPHRLRTNGVVKSSMPYVYNGNLIEGISVTFKDGVAVEYSAEKGNDLLHHMLGADEGALHLGEIALVPASSPIRQSGILFYDTLFDENAACHMAFGAGYPGTVHGGNDMSREELMQKGVNDSIIHEDIMIGTEDMKITGKTKTGELIAIFENGEWVK